MSAAAEAAPAPKGGNKKLIIIIVAVLVLVLAGGGAAMMLMKKGADTEEVDDEDGAPAPKKKAAATAPRKPPTFVPLDPFTVNLADRDADRYAQVGITLEIQDAAVDAQIKAFMPVIRNNILLALSDQKATDLMGREGKARLAVRIQRETSRALGVEIAAEEETEEAEEAAPASKKRRRRAEPELPITAVHFSNFIIQ